MLRSEARSGPERSRKLLRLQHKLAITITLYAVRMPDASSGDADYPSRVISSCRSRLVALPTGVRWAQSWRMRGSVEPGKVGGHMRPLLEGERELAAGADRAEEGPDAARTVGAAARGAGRGGVLRHAVPRALREDIKKRRSSPRNKIGPTSSAAAIAGTGSSAG